MTSTALFTTAAFSLALGACALDSGQFREPTEEGESDHIASDRIGLDDLFAAAGEEFDVPGDLLKAVSYVETGWEMVEGVDHHDHGHDTGPALGLMALRGERLTRGAELAGVSVEDIGADELSSLRAGAALLDEYARVRGTDRSDLGDWAMAVADFSGIEHPDAQRDYVTRQVYGVLYRGAVVELEGGHIVATIDARDVEPNYPLPDSLAHAGGTDDYADAIWRASPNHSSRPTGAIGDVAMVVIHTCEGGYSGCWGWLSNSAAGASAHYVVSKGGEVSQLVREYRKAWHIAADYSSSRNGGLDPWRNGYNSNNFTIGIEHAGYASQTSFDKAQLEASARLVCDITRDHNIPRDRKHIFGHGQMQPWNRTDPGANWPWDHYISRVRAYCGDGDGGLVIDSNNANNDQNEAYIEVSESWNASNSSAGYFGTGYYWADTEAEEPIETNLGFWIPSKFWWADIERAPNDGATFWFHLDKDQQKTIDAWWVAGDNRSAHAPVVAYDPDGNVVGKVLVNQQQDGGRWTKLGTWNFKAGWNKVVVSRRVGDEKVVIADALRVR